MVDRAWTALMRAEPDFGVQARALSLAVIGGGFTNVDAFANSPMAAEAGPAGTAMAIIGALYTGRVGTGPSTSVCGYENALMYQPTLATTTIPTYASGGAGWWAAKPGKDVADA